MGTPILPNDPEELFEDEARKNRKKFLKPYFERYKKLKAKNAEKEIAALIAELIKLEPSHLAEPWILWEVIEWLRLPGIDCVEYLEDAFTKQKGRNRQTERQNQQVYKDFFLIQTIDRIKDEKSVNRTDACKILAQRIADDPKKFRIYPQWNLENENDDLVKRLSDRYNRDKNKYLEHCERRDKDRQKMPFPYFGRDLRPL